MAYTIVNFKSKKAVKEAIDKGEMIEVYQPEGIGSVPMNGTVSLEGPHYPAPHSWYGTGTMRDGYLISIK